jgi:citrate synthase
MDDNTLYLSAKEAASELGISVTTLYAYVSRKGIRSIQVEGTRSRRYFRSDIERLKSSGRTGVQDPESRWLVSETGISLLTKDGLFYRGKNVDILAETSSFEQTAAILWGVEEESIFGGSLPVLPRGYAALYKQIKRLPLAEQVLMLLPYVESSNPRSFDLSRKGFCRTGADVIRLYAAILCGRAEPSVEPIHEFVAEALSAPPGFDDIIRRFLVLFADHEMSPATYSVRALANTGVTPYQIVSTGIMAFNGRRLGIVVTEGASRMLEEIINADDPATPILRRIRSGESLPGFESGVHEIMDPRPQHLLHRLGKVLVDDEEFGRLGEAIRVAAEVADGGPSFALVTAFIGRKLGFRGEERLLAGLGRIAGWVAHASEQYHEHELFRCRADYTGDLPE